MASTLLAQPMKGSSRPIRPRPARFLNQVAKTLKRLHLRSSQLFKFFPRHAICRPGADVFATTSCVSFPPQLLTILTSIVPSRF
ncbi:hypothetical protein MY4038_007730 [Beauveria bassiana]|uniref:Uncharacterized protein n=2 Tax=Beauveria bassiana TaxID=176275 RepID=J5J5N0_BEAB2|nr:uncharacterized protein BBA_09215 [Beauveria bassiana ARSEF 2860]EJP61878.1 hypothetical protein BBA_09215 [Beauveria bassiana ARSEF 2860]PQK18017.1 hypothetical protein BB8028_0010g00100 [Beauveria bassiana]